MGEAAKGVLVAAVKKGSPVQEAPQDSTVMPLGEVVHDPELDESPLVDPELDAATASAEAAADGAAPSGNEETPRPKRSGKIIALVAVGALVASAAVLAANALGGDSSGSDLPLLVESPAVVVNALAEAGLDCRGSAVTGDVATCNTMVAVRIFPDERTAQDWIDEVLKDPMTNSSVGWVRHGNAVVAAPLVATPEIATALGPASKKF